MAKPAVGFLFPNFRKATNVSGNPIKKTMTGNLVQIISLTAYGNDYLENGTNLLNYYPINSVFQFCNRVDFREFYKPFFFFKRKEKIIATDPIEWFTHLKKGGCQKLRLAFEFSKDQSFAKDHKLAGLSGGGGIYPNYSNFWVNRWDVTNENDPDRKIWTVNYAEIVKGQPTENRQINQSEIKDKLKKTLNEIAAFAYKQKLEDWGTQFTKAELNLDSLNPSENYYHKDLLPSSIYTLTTRQLLFSAGMAWVFGGMGSWNDLGFDSEIESEIYERLSEELYSDIVLAVISSINSN